MYIVHTPKSRKALLQTNCLRTADKFAKLGIKRCIFDSVTGKQCTQGGIIGLTLAEFKGGYLA